MEKMSQEEKEEFLKKKEEETIRKLREEEEEQKAEEVRELSESLVAKPLRDHLIKTGQLEPGSKEDKERFQEFFKPARDETKVPGSSAGLSAASSPK
eukprot:jgi/Pico_ML_1/54131/g4550.t2